MNGHKAKERRRKAERMYDVLYGQTKKPNRLWLFIKKYIIGMRVFNWTPSSCLMFYGFLPCTLVCIVYKTDEKKVSN